MGPFIDGWDVAKVEAVLARGDPLYTPIVITLDLPDAPWAQELCIRLAAHAHARTRANAMLGLGHLARTCGMLDQTRVRPLLSAALADADQDVRAHAATAANSTAAPSSPPRQGSPPAPPPACRGGRLRPC